MITMIIKGTIEQAIAAAAGRGIPLMLVSENAVQQVCAYTDNEHASTLTGWLCEPSAPQDGAGFPAGTLLWHSAPR
jgi:hypothetical protein